MTELKIKYFDTIHVTSTVCVLKSCFRDLLVRNLGIMHSTISKESCTIDVESSFAILVEIEEGFQPVFFHPRGMKKPY